MPSSHTHWKTLLQAIWIALSLMTAEQTIITIASCRAMYLQIVVIAGKRSYTGTGVKEGDKCVRVYLVRVQGLGSGALGRGPNRLERNYDT